MRTNTTTITTAVAVVASKKMKAWDCIKAVLLPSRYGKYLCRNFKLACALLCGVYILSFICTVSAFRRCASEIYDDAAQIIIESEDFYMSDFRFYYKGEKYERNIESLGLTVVFDPDANPPSAADKAVLYIGPDEAAILTDFFKYSVIYSQLSENPDDIDFNKQTVVSEIDYGKNIMLNLICSTSVLLATVLAVVLLLTVLLISLIISALCWFFKAELVFEQKLFMSIASLIYPFIIGTVIVIMPGGLELLINYASVVFRLYSAVALLYIILCFVSLRKTHEQKTNN